tara:strand:- start:2708 stop:2968 length:261 start_codon:yes stop_codon:yes gene_type:complete
MREITQAKKTELQAFIKPMAAVIGGNAIPSGIRSQLVRDFNYVAREIDVAPVRLGCGPCTITTAKNIIEALDSAPVKRTHKKKKIE